jgi:hypothetical protein
MRLVAPEPPPPPLPRVRLGRHYHQSSSGPSSFAARARLASCSAAGPSRPAMPLYSGELPPCLGFGFPAAARPPRRSGLQRRAPGAGPGTGRGVAAARGSAWHPRFLAGWRDAFSRGRRWVEMGSRDSAE